MKLNTSHKTLVLAVGMAAAALSPVALADASSNPFAAVELSGGYMQLAEGKDAAKKVEGEGSCGEGKDAAKKVEGEGSCGEGKCGEDKDAAKKVEGESEGDN